MTADIRKELDSKKRGGSGGNGKSSGNIVIGSGSGTAGSTTSVESSSSSNNSNQSMPPKRNIVTMITAVEEEDIVVPLEEGKDAGELKLSDEFMVTVDPHQHQHQHKHQHQHQHQHQPQQQVVQHDDHIPGPPPGTSTNQCRHYPVTTAVPPHPQQQQRQQRPSQPLQQPPPGSSACTTTTTTVDFAISTAGMKAPTVAEGMVVPTPSSAAAFSSSFSSAFVSSGVDFGNSSHRSIDPLDISKTEHQMKGSGILASRKDLNLPPEEFAAGCNLLQAAASGNRLRMAELLSVRPNHVNFRDYDRRTALHVAASEGHLSICQFLIEEKGASINRSDRWGGSPLDDAHRHRHQEVVRYLRQHGALTGSVNQAVNLITAAAEGDYDEVQTLLSFQDNPNGSRPGPVNLIDMDPFSVEVAEVDETVTATATTEGTVTPGAPGAAPAIANPPPHTIPSTNATKLVNQGDYDQRTALHLAAREGHPSIVKLLCYYHANVNAEDQWGSTPLDDALRANNLECAQILQQYGAVKGSNNKLSTAVDLSHSQKQREQDNLKVDFEELEIRDRIGAGAFGEIYKCEWRGILVAAKCIKSTKIRQHWLKKRAIEHMKSVKSVRKDIAKHLQEQNNSDDNSDEDSVDKAVEALDQVEADQNNIMIRKGAAAGKKKEGGPADASEASTSEMNHEKELALADFRQEISVLKSLRHPHIVLLLAYSTTEDYEVMISELMKCSLLDVLNAHIVHGTKMEKSTSIRHATQLAQGMHYLHTCKPPIIHRDLKPANLLIDDFGVLKISDFGLAKMRPASDRNKQHSDLFNMTGETGSYRFMAPEVYRHEKYDETVDIYSYAMIFFYLLDGRPPFSSYNGLMAVQKAANDGERPIIPRSWHQTLQSILTECWDDNPRARTPFWKIVKQLEQYSNEEKKHKVVRGQRKRDGAGVDSQCCIIQ